FRIHAITHLMNIKVSKKYIQDVEIMSNIYLLSELVSSFFIDIDDKKQLDLNFIDIKIPSFKTIFSKFYGPEDSFTDITYGEYCDLQRFFNSFNATGDVHFLYLMTSIFYRQRKIFSKQRLPYSSEQLDKRCEHFKKYAPLSLVYAVYIQFLAFQSYLPTAKIDWGGQELDFSILYEGERTEDTIPGIGADSMVYTLAENG